LRDSEFTVSDPDRGPVSINRKNVQAWVRAAQQGDVESFEKLYRHYVGLVYGLCLRMLANPVDAEDCVQATFVKGWTQISRFEGRSDFGTWLHRIAVNEVLMEDRRRKRRFELVRAQSESSEAAGNPEDALDFEDAIAALPVRRRHVFVLKAVYGYSHEEVADLLGIAAGTARAQYHQARQALMRELSEED